jgi:hypothetical protein
MEMEGAGTTRDIDADVEAAGNEALPVVL